MSIKVLLIGVSHYSPTIGAQPLPLCKNDLVAMKAALMKGLKVCPNDIITIGDNTGVMGSQFLDSLQMMNALTTENDTFIFYFSGHGGKVVLY